MVIPSEAFAQMWTNILPTCYYIWTNFVKKNLESTTDELDAAVLICIDAFIAKNQSDFTKESNGRRDSDDAKHTRFTCPSQNGVDKPTELLSKFNLLASMQIWTQHCPN